MVLLGRRGKEPTICKIPRGAVLFVLGCMPVRQQFLAYVAPGMGAYRVFAARRLT